MFSFELFAVIALVIFAFGDLIAGVANDAVNFLNSAIGSKVTTRRVIMLFASVGLIIGATFSDGIIEVARKGIFRPEMFTLQEAIIIFTAVAITDMLVLDLYSTFGLPTSTTVSLVFEILGGALALAMLKLGNFEAAWETINASSVLGIVTGIIMSIGIALIAGLIIQFITRLIFTFEYKEKFAKWGFLWSGAAITSILFFILLKGGKHASFMTEEINNWISSNTNLILILSFTSFSIISLILVKLKVNILKLIILVGTAALAMAFAGNDLANFIGVSVSGVHAYLGANLSEELSTPVWVLLIAGIVMAVTIFYLEKAKSVTATEIILTSHDKHASAHWKSNIVIEKFIALTLSIFKIMTSIIPKRAKKWISSRWEGTRIKSDEKSAFDLLRASVNLVVAAALISIATSKKLPLSTTYVTFIVAMGTSLADKAWGKDCAPSRIAGIFTVIGSWFVTAIISFMAAGITVGILYYMKSYGVILLFVLATFISIKLIRIHKRRVERKGLKELI